MTEPLPYIEDVQKLTDAKEISQAYMGLKDTNRCSASLYISSTISSHVLNHKSITSHTVYMLCEVLFSALLIVKSSCFTSEVLKL